MTPPAKVSRTNPSPAVRHLGFLAPDVLLLTGTTQVSETPDHVTLVKGRRRTELEHDFLPLDWPGRKGDRTWLLVAVVPPADVGSVSGASVEVGSSPPVALLDEEGVGSEVSDLPSLLLDLVTDPGAHGDVLAWLHSVAPRANTVHPDRLCDSLFAIREVLRERLPRCELLPHARHGLSLDLVLAVDERTFYLKGWSRSAGAPLARLTAVSPEGDRSELLATAFRHPRGDVAEFYAPRAAPDEDLRHGFIATIELPVPSVRADGWLVEAVDADGDGVEAFGPPVQRDVAATRQLVLFDAVYEEPGEDTLRATHLAPALRCLQDRWHRSIGAARVDTYGTPPEEPAVTIIVPLFQRLEFLEHQLAQFVHDDEISASELLYVLDSPADEAWLRHLATTLFPLYRVPFRTIVMSHNGGFAAANNVGASVARGDKLLLLNSDVLPDRPGWVGRMARFYDQTPGIGALGVKLLYEDDSLQHAGLYFKLVSGGATWNNEHLYKGLHRSFPGANVTRPVPAVTAACMMVDRQLFSDVGGLSTAYVQGDYEDSDLCLRLAQDGRQTWYLPSVELYHLEGQSYPSVLRAQTASYNQWLHTHLWGDAIEEIAATWETAPPAEASVSSVRSRALGRGDDSVEQRAPDVPAAARA